MSYSVFRVQGVKNTSSLAGLGKHNKDRISHTNPDIDKDKSCENIELIRCEGTYNQKFKEITKELKKNHDERMKIMRSDRVKTFEKSINDDKTDVACEMVFTSDESFFKGMDKEDITRWAKCSLEFVTKAIGIPKKDIIHATVHMDEKTPHLHVVAVPIATVYDGRKKKDVLKISRAKFIGGKLHLSKLQDAYNERMNDNGFKLERGTKGTAKSHTDTVSYKKEQLAKLEKQIENNKKIIEQQEKLLSRSSSMNKKIDEIVLKPHFLDKSKSIVANKDIDFLKETSKSAVSFKDKVDRLKNSCIKKDETIGALSSKLSGYADEIVGLKKKIKVKDKNISTLLNQRKALVIVCKEYDPELIEKANEKLHKFNKPKTKEKIKNKDWDIER